MKLGIFDSGLGGVLIARALHQKFPALDKTSLGDTLNLPYGSRSEEAIYKASKNCVDALFRQGCQVIIVACNTASARALRRLQQEYLPEHYLNRRVLGVVVPTIEEALDRGDRKLAVIGTNYTINSRIYTTELSKINPDIEIVEKSTPLLVPLIENDGDAYLDDVLRDYVSFMNDQQFDALLLGCTHYIHLKERIRSDYDFDVISQDEIIPQKLEAYFERHPEHFSVMTRNSSVNFYVTDLTQAYSDKASELFGQDINIQLLEDVHECT